MNAESTNVSVPLEAYRFDRQSDLAIFAADSVMKALFTEFTSNSFSESSEQDLEKYCNETLAIKSQSRELLSKATLRVSLVRLGKNFPSIAELPYKKVLDKMKEFLNQFLGVINQNLNSHLGITFRIGLPTHLNNLTESYENAIVPGVRIIDSTGTFELYLGYVRIRGTEDINLDGLEFNLESHDDDDIDFF